MKVIILLVAIGAIALGVMYFKGGYSSFDPTEQGKQARAAIKPGMAWDKVVDVAGAPKKVRVFREKDERQGGELVKTIAPGAPFDWDRKAHEERIADKKMPHGFIFLYPFSNQVAFSVYFDKNGDVDGIRDETTMSDLLNGNIRPNP